MVNYHAKSAAEVLKELGVSKNGLNVAEVDASRIKFGGNEITPKAEDGFIKRVGSENGTENCPLSQIQD